MANAQTQLYVSDIHTLCAAHQPGRDTRYSALSELNDVEVMWQEPLARHTTFRIGGPVSCLARPRTEKALIDLIRTVRLYNMPHFILGGGSNLLGPDEPWDVVAIQPGLACSKIGWIDTSGKGSIGLYVGAGVRVAQWLRFCLQHGLRGAEFLVGIPGMVGGALVMNAGTREGCIADGLIQIDILDGEGKRRQVPRSELSPVYRSMQLPKEWIVLGGCFELQPSGNRALRLRLLELMRQRKRNQPLGWPSAGCIFKNPPSVSAGALIDRSGLKGLRLGDGQISEKHANWIINRGNARARDVIALIECMEKRVFENFGVRLEREIKILEVC